jgi:hypothetical protein
LNQSNPKKRAEYKEQNGRTRIQEDKRTTTQEGKQQREHQVLEAYQIGKREDLLKGGLA